MKESKLDRSNKEFLNPYVTVDVVLLMVHENQLKALLIKRDKQPFEGMWTLPGAFPLAGETTKDTAKRVLRDKVGLKEEIYMEQLYTFDTLDRDPRGVVFAVTYFALVPYETYQHIDHSHSLDATLFSCSGLPKTGFDHKDIIRLATARLEGKLAYTNIAYAALPELFTLTMLQKIYEIITGTEIDKRNFRKKIEQLDIIVPTKEKLTGMKQRPAILYKFKHKKLIEIKPVV